MKCSLPNHSGSTGASPAEGQADPWCHSNAAAQPGRQEAVCDHVPPQSLGQAVLPGHGRVSEIGRVKGMKQLSILIISSKICCSHKKKGLCSQERLSAHFGGRGHGEGRTAPEHRIRHRLWGGAEGARPGARGPLPRGRLHLRHLPRPGMTFGAVEAV